MNKMKSFCAGCYQNLPKREYLTCMLCNDNYDLKCANVPETRFYNTMTNDHKQAWRCQSCLCKMPKTNNTNTPARSQHSQLLATPFLDDTHNNVTQRKKNSDLANKNISTLDDSALSTLGDTIDEGSTPHVMQNISVTQEQPFKNIESGESTITLHQFNLLLQQNNKSIVDAITVTIHKEIEAAITQFGIQITQKIDTLHQDQTKIKQDVKELDHQISMMSIRLKELQGEHEKLQTQIQNSDLNSKKLTQEHSEKTIVLHGLQETCWETEGELLDRITNIFYDVLNINLSGYIEDISRIGRNGSNRPLKIELISKRKTKEILQNTQYFRHTGLAVTEYLNKIALQERKQLKMALRNARNNGKHAIIKNNKLIIEGREVTLKTDAPSISIHTKTLPRTPINSTQKAIERTFQTKEHEISHQPHKSTFRNKM